MAQINITLNQDEILRLLADSNGKAFEMLLKEALNSVLLAESAEQLHAAPYERTEERTDSRNGVRTRPLTTRIGTIELTVPRHRNVPFRTLVFDNYKRSEAALITTMAEMVVGGVSTAKVGKVMETLCGKSFSKQTVSEACKELDAHVESFRNRRLEKEYPFVMADATYLKVREDHKVIAKALLIAIGFTPAGRKEVIGLDLVAAETRGTWTAFLSSLKERGLHGVRMITSDAHEGLISAIHSEFPTVAWQRCQAHFARNIVEDVPKRLKEGLRCELVEMFNCDTIEAARKRRDEIIRDYSEAAPKAMERLDEGFEDSMTIMALPDAMRRCTRTSNYLERLNKEVKRRAKVIGVFPNAASVIRLVGALLMEENERWAAMRQIYFSPSCEELARKAEDLVMIAQAQRLMRKAA